MAERHSELVVLAAPASKASPRVYRLGILSSPLVRTFVFLFADLSALVVAHMVALRLIDRFLRIPISVQNPSEYHRYYIPFLLAVFFYFEKYRSPELRRPEKELEASCKAVFIAFIALMFFNFFVFKGEVFSRYLLVTWLVISCVLLLAVRSTLRFIYARLWDHGLAQRTAILIGSSAELAEYQRLLSIQRYTGYNLLGVISKWGEVGALGSIEDWERIVDAAKPNSLILALPSHSGSEELFKRVLAKSTQMGIDLQLYSSLLASAQIELDKDEFTGCLRLRARPRWSCSLQHVLKRGFDVLIGVVGGLVTLALVPVVWLVINLEDRGPVFHMREFVGCDGEIRYYRKFRTMLKDADEILRRDPELKARFASQFKLKDDPRMLRIGRFLRRYSIDEFPQFFSVLSGQLTFVGPRVISNEEKKRYGDLLPKLLSCKPGVTGFWQVTGRQTTTYEERVQMDMFYIDHWSLWLDIAIVAKTFWKVLKAEGAY